MTTSSVNKRMILDLEYIEILKYKWTIVAENLVLLNTPKTELTS